MKDVYIAKHLDEVAFLHLAKLGVEWTLRDRQAYIGEVAGPFKPEFIDTRNIFELSRLRFRF
jgi:hypothetical protein